VGDRRHRPGHPGDRGRRATGKVEGHSAADDDPSGRIVAYLAVADELRPASQRFFDDGAFRKVDSAFVADLVANEMSRIQTGAIHTATGLGDADA
jgi:hypothetical protein